LAPVAVAYFQPGPFYPEPAVKSIPVVFLMADYFGINARNPRKMASNFRFLFLVFSIPNIKSFDYRFFDLQNGFTFVGHALSLTFSPGRTRKSFELILIL
jgi:hypothetical protein